MLHLIHPSIFRNAMQRDAITDVYILDVNSRVALVPLYSGRANGGNGSGGPTVVGGRRRIRIVLQTAPPAQFSGGINTWKLQDESPRGGLQQPARCGRLGLTL